MPDENDEGEAPFAETNPNWAHPFGIMTAAKAAPLISKEIG